MGKLTLDRMDPQTASDAEVMEAMKIEARSEFQAMMDNRVYQIYPDHVAFPNVFAWAVKNVFTREEIAKIPFDHGQDAESFCNKFGFETARVVAEVRKQLRDSKLMSNIAWR